MINEVWASNEEFHNRFWGEPAPLEAAILKDQEENGEVIKAAISESDWRLACEMADRLYTSIGIMRSRGIPPEMFLEACQEVVDKNNRKTLDNYHIGADGLVERRVK